MPKKKLAGFTIAFNRLLRHPDLSLQSKAIFLIIKSFANKDNDYCYPSLEKIAEYAACSVSTVKRAIIELEDIGILYSQQRRTKTQKLSSSAFLFYDDQKTWIPVKNRVPQDVPPQTTGELRQSSPVSYGDDPKIVPFTEENRIEEKEPSIPPLIANAVIRHVRYSDD